MKRFVIILGIIILSADVVSADLTKNDLREITKIVAIVPLLTERIRGNPAPDKTLIKQMMPTLEDLKERIEKLERGEQGRSGLQVPPKGTKGG